MSKDITYDVVDTDVTDHIMGMQKIRERDEHIGTFAKIQSADASWTGLRIILTAASTCRDSPLPEACWIKCIMGRM